MIDRGHKLPLIRQAAVLGISRGSLYYSACPVPAAELAIMRRIDELHLDYPFAGSRMLRDLLRGEGISIGREQVTTMMRRMAIEAVYRRPHTSKPADGYKVFPYLLRGITIERPNQAWAMDITYIPMARGFVYLGAVMDWFSRRVLAWRVSISMESIFALTRSTRRWSGMAGRRSSTPTRAANSPVRMDAGPGATMCSSSGCGVR
jgi:putative transposase